LLRFLLWSKKEIPWNYSAFLDEAARRVLLLREGGGYTFFHDLLKEHFATQGSQPKLFSEEEVSAQEDVPVQTQPVNFGITRVFRDFGEG
jgi:hypothetical protein